MEMTIYEQMVKAVEFYNEHKPLKTVTTVVYTHKENKEDSFIESEKTLADAFKAGKSLADYEKVIETINPKQDLKKMIFGDKSHSPLVVSNFVNILSELTGKSTVEAPASSEDAGKKEMKKAKQRVYNVAGGAISTITLEEAIKEADQVYKKYDKKFKYNPKPKK